MVTLEDRNSHGKCQKNSCFDISDIPAFKNRKEEKTTSDKDASENQIWQLCIQHKEF